MNAIKWSTVLLGMGTLVLGLNIQATFVFTKQDYGLVVASWCYVLGALVLILPPSVELFMSSNSEVKSFSKLLIVLEVFLVLSGLLFFWKSNLWGKIAVRILVSLLVTAYIKYGLHQLPEFKWNILWCPQRLICYHIECLSGALGPAYLLSLGIDWLGIGYAFLEFPFGKLALLLGSSFLLVSSYRGYRISGAGIPLAWSVLNVIYLIYSLVFLVFDILG